MHPNDPVVFGNNYFQRGNMDLMLKMVHSSNAISNRNEKSGAPQQKQMNNFSTEEVAPPRVRREGGWKLQPEEVPSSQNIHCGRLLQPLKEHLLHPGLRSRSILQHYPSRNLYPIKMRPTTMVPTPGRKVQQSIKVDTAQEQRMDTNLNADLQRQSQILRLQNELRRQEKKIILLEQMMKTSKNIKDFCDGQRDLPPCTSLHQNLHAIHPLKNIPPAYYRMPMERGTVPMNNLSYPPRYYSKQQAHLSNPYYNTSSSTKIVNAAIDALRLAT